MNRNIKDSVKKLAACVGIAAAGIAMTSCIFLPPDHTSNNNGVSGEYTLVWSDEFDGSTLNQSNWVYETGHGDNGWGNNEVQNYTADKANCYVSDGTLKIKAVKNGSGWTSARIKTQGKHSWKYGYIEARLKMPEGNSGIWPAFWMMPENSAYGVWPRSGELDIMEYAPGTCGTGTFATIHHSKSRTESGADVYPSLGKKVISSRSSEFHTYALKWTETYVEAFYDGVSLGTKYINDGNGWVNWPFDQNFFVILNLAVGGNLGGSIPSNMTEATYEIDYVRVFQ